MNTLYSNDDTIAALALSFAYGIYTFEVWKNGKWRPSFIFDAIFVEPIAFTCSTLLKDAPSTTSTPTTTCYISQKSKASTRKLMIDSQEKENNNGEKNTSSLGCPTLRFVRERESEGSFTDETLSVRPVICNMKQTHKWSQRKLINLVDGNLMAVHIFLSTRFDCFSMKINTI